jgi:RNA polymerase sigma-70 factor (ECF subfamily)
MPWALRIAQLQALAHLKRQQRFPMTFDEPLIAVLADEAIAERSELDPRRHALTGCLQKLPDDQRTLIATRYEPGGSVNELARRSGKTPKAMSETLRRIRRALLDCIERSVAREARI